jgi:hypothetical protein
MLTLEIALTLDDNGGVRLAQALEVAVSSYGLYTHYIALIEDSFGSRAIRCVKTARGLSLTFSG